MRSGEAYCYSEFMTMLATDCEHCRSHYNFVNLYGDDEHALSEEGHCDITGHSIALSAAQDDRDLLCWILSDFIDYDRCDADDL